MNVMLDEGGIRTAVQSAPDTCEDVWWGKKLAAVRVKPHSREAPNPGAAAHGGLGAPSPEASPVNLN